MKKLRCLRLKKGMTLVETMISLLILTVLVMISAGIIISTGNIFARNAVLSDSRMITQRIARYISDKLFSCDMLDISMNNSAFVGKDKEYIESIVISNEGSQIYLYQYDKKSGNTTSEKIYDKTELGDRKIKVKFDDSEYAAKGYLKLNVSLYDNDVDGIDGNVIFSLDRIVNVLNSKTIEPEFNVLENTSLNDIYITYSFKE